MFWLLQAYHKIIWKLLKGIIRGVAGWDLHFKDSSDTIVEAGLERARPEAGEPF